MRAFPSIFPRHLDVTYRRLDDLIVVQDTQNDDEFKLFKISIDPSKKRKDGAN